MHDFHLAQQIVKIAQDHAQKNGLDKIDKIVIELGDIVEHGAAIAPESLEYNINLLLPCEVEVKKIKGDSWKLISINGK